MVTITMTAYAHYMTNKARVTKAVWQYAWSEKHLGTLEEMINGLKEMFVQRLMGSEAMVCTLP